MGTDLRVSVEASETAEMRVVGFPHNTTSWGTLIHMSSVQYEQSKDAIIRLSLPRPADSLKLKITVTARFTRVGGGREDVVSECTVAPYSSDVVYTIHRYRLELVDHLMAVIKEGGEGPGLAKRMRQLVDSAECDAHHPQVAAITRDISGQVVEAMSQRYFRKWGQHYLPSLAMAHLLQQVSLHFSFFPLSSSQIAKL